MVNNLQKDLIKIRELGEGQAIAVAATELFEREGGMDEKSIGSRFLFFLPNGVLSTQIGSFFFQTH